MMSVEQGGIVCKTGVFGKVYEWNHFDPIKVIPNGVCLTGFYSNYPTQPIMQDIFRFMDEHQLKPLIGATCDFDNIRDAFIALDDGKVNGKDSCVGRCKIKWRSKMLKEVSYKKLNLNPMTLFGEEWLALAAGNEKSGYKVMCIALGHMGTLWEQDSHANRLPTVTCFIRPQRYTKEFMDKEELFSIRHFSPSMKKVLGYIGSHSGRDGDKIKEAGLTPVFDNGTTYFAEANLVFIYRKLYQAQLIESGFMDKRLIDFNYPARDYHEMYVGEIIKVFLDSEA